VLLADPGIGGSADSSWEVDVAMLENQVAPVESVLEDEPAKRRLLLIEDDWRTQTALRKILSRLGWEVHSAMTVAAGLALLDLKPEAVLLDLMLPDGDGAAVIRQVRAESLEMKVIVTTGIEDRRRLEYVRGLQPDAVLRKPVELDDLLRILETERP
jgi:DNA-binding response OmpR family regulator